MQNTEIKGQGPKQVEENYTFKQRLLLSLLVAFAAAFTACFFGPFDVFAGNQSHFGFVIYDFFGWMFLYGGLFFAAILVVLLPMRGTLFDVFFGAVTGCATMLFLQGNYLNGTLNSLVGDGNGADITSAATYINTGIWVVVVVGFMFLSVYYRKIFKSVATVAMVTVIGVQLITGLVTSLTTPAWSSEVPVWEEDGETDSNYFLTYHNLESASASGKNIYYFVVDRFDVDYYEIDGLRDCPELFSEMTGFTYYNDMVSMYPRTFPAIPYMLTGYETDYSMGRVPYLKEAYTNQSDFLRALKAQDYDVNIYTDEFYGYHNAAYLKDYVSNYSESKGYFVNSPVDMSIDMLRLSLYRYAPHCLKYFVAGSVGTATFDQYITYFSDAPRYTTDMKNAYDYLTENPMKVKAKGNTFSFVHLSGTHLPNSYDENFGPVGDQRSSIYAALQQSFKIINRFLTQLKEKGLYEDATIIITGDHSALHTDVRVPEVAHLTALFFKPSGVSEGEIVTSTAPVMQGDILPAIIESAGVTCEKDFGPSLTSIKEGQARERKHCFQVIGTNGESNEYVTFKINGLARDFKNWQIVDRYEIGSLYY